MPFPHFYLFDCRQYVNSSITKGNKAAGVRARKSLQDLKQLAQDLRVAIQRCKTENAHLRYMERNTLVDGDCNLPFQNNLNLNSQNMMDMSSAMTHTTMPANDNLFSMPMTALPPSSQSYPPVRSDPILFPPHLQ